MLGSPRHNSIIMDALAEGRISRSGVTVERRLLSSRIMAALCRDAAMPGGCYGFRLALRHLAKPLQQQVRYLPGGGDFQPEGYQPIHQAGGAPGQEYHHD